MKRANARAKVYIFFTPMHKKVLLRARVRKFHFWVGIGTSSRENTSDSHHSQHDLSEKQVIILTQCATISHLHENISGFIMHFPDWHSEVSLSPRWHIHFTAVTVRRHRGGVISPPRWHPFSELAFLYFTGYKRPFTRIQTYAHKPSHSTDKQSSSAIANPKINFRHLKKLQKSPISSLQTSSPDNKTTNHFTLPGQK